jgi:hypothetical protein
MAVCELDSYMELYERFLDYLERKCMRWFSRWVFKEGLVKTVFASLKDAYKNESEVRQRLDTSVILISTSV